MRRLLFSPLNSCFSNERSKWIFSIGLVAIGVGIIAKVVISYPSECVPEAIEGTNLKLSFVSEDQINGQTKSRCSFFLICFLIAFSEQSSFFMGFQR